MHRNDQTRLKHDENYILFCSKRPNSLHANDPEYIESAHSTQLLLNNSTNYLIVPIRYLIDFCVHTQTLITRLLVM